MSEEAAIQFLKSYCIKNGISSDRLPSDYILGLCFRKAKWLYELFSKERQALDDSYIKSKLNGGAHYAAAIDVYNSTSGSKIC